ncbi:MAG: TolC family protein [Treponema sp.]|jgi:outer membrane protein TolC|nr:TolC family protein [Treponema sp.]
MNLKKRNLRAKAGVLRNADGLKIPVCLAMLILLCANLSAQEVPEQSAPTQDTPAQEAQTQNAPMRISPDEAVEMALRNNLSLESSRVGLSTKRRASDLSWNQFIPNITVAGILSRDNEQGSTTVTIPIPGTGTSVSQEGINGRLNPTLFVSDPMNLPQWHIAGNIQASITVSAAMFENMRRLRLDYEAGAINYERAKLQLERDVRKAYHSILLLQENIALLRGSFTNAERQVQIAQANFYAGLAPELVFLQARVARENMRPIIDQAENGLRLSLAQFAMFLDLPINTQFELIPLTESADFIPIDVAEMISQAARGRPDIQELRHTILMLQSARRAQLLALTPSLTLSWNSTSAFLKDPWEEAWFGNSDNWRDSGSFSITFALRLHSLIPYSSDFQGIKTLEDQIRIANIGLAQMITGTEIEIYNTVLALERTHTNAQALEQTVALAEQAYRLTEQAYGAGLQDYFQVQSAEQSLRQARVQLLEQQFTYLNGLIDLEYAIGVPFGTLSKRRE